MFDSQTIARFIFLFFIISMSVYFMFTNKSTIEKFSDTQQESDALPKDKDSLAKIIKGIYADLKLGEPSQKAVDFYTDFVMQRTITKDALREVIDGSALALEKTLKDSGSTSQESIIVFGTEDEVTEIYNEILFRNPDDAELYNFSKLLKTDKTFDLEKLKQLLYASEEYKRMEKTQTNKVFSNQMGGVTDRQLTLIVNTIYKDVTKNDLNDKETLVFLKKKLLQFNLDQETFKKFIAMYVQGKPFEPDQKSKDEEQKLLQDALKANAAAQKITAANIVTKDDFDKFRQDVLNQVKQSLQNQPKDTQQEQGQNQPNKQIIEVLLRTAKDSQNENYLDSQNIMKTIKEEAKCVFNKDGDAYGYGKNIKSQDMAQLQDARNTEELGNICIRNQKFLGVDEDMVLDPSLKWSVPQRHPPVCIGGANAYQPLVDQTSLIGTLLEESKNTKVGSILPEIPPR